MTLVIILAAIIASYFGLYWLISMEIKDHKYEIMNKLKLIEKQNNMLREEVNELRSQVESVWVNTQVIKDYTRPEENDTGTKRKNTQYTI